MNKLKNDLLDVFHAGVKAVDPCTAIEKYVRAAGDELDISGKTYDLSRYKRIFVIGAGKASAAMARSLEKKLEYRVTGGIVIVKYGHQVPLKRIRVAEAGHPIPDESGIRATADIVSLLKDSDKNDLVIFLVSGGGSALLTYPLPGLNLSDIKEMTRILLESGASIQEMNVLRKHLSRVKGGRLARIALPSPLISLVLSDVIDDDLSSIASGPMVPDPSTFTDCLKILDKYNLRSRMPLPILEILDKGEKGEMEETPTEDDPVFKQTQNVIVANILLALEEAKHRAESLGYNTWMLSSSVTGETRIAAQSQASFARKIKKKNIPVKKPACLISGGETTVTVHGKGLGGRNQEFVLAAGLELDGEKDIAVLSCGTDGTDGPTDAAGAFADGNTIRRALELGMDAESYLNENDSYHFFQKLDDLILTGPTYTNVMDLMVFLIR